MIKIFIFLYIIFVKGLEVFLSTYLYCQMLTQITPNTPILLCCEKCNFKCSKKGDFKRHLLTRKHTNIDKMLTYVDQITSKKHHVCLCGKEYQYKQSLSTHKKTCSAFIETEETNKINNETHLSNETMEILAFWF
jgi:uncharacterized Zn-finger protein